MDSGTWNATEASSQLVAANKNRGQVTIQFNSGAPMYIGIGQHAAYGEGVMLRAVGGSITLTGYVATQAIYGVCDTGYTASGGYQEA